MRNKSIIEMKDKMYLFKPLVTCWAIPSTPRVHAAANPDSNHLDIRYGVDVFSPSLLQHTAVSTPFCGLRGFINETLFPTMVLN